MPRITKAQKAGLDFLDQIFFNEMIVHRGLNVEERQQIRTITARVAQMAEREHSGVEVEVIKHMAYYLLEIHLVNSVDDWREALPLNLPPLAVPQEAIDTFNQFKENWQMASILASSETASEIVPNYAWEIYVRLKDEFAGYSALVRRDLVKRCFVHDCSDASVKAYCWLAISGVLPVSKKVPDQAKCDLSPEFMMRLTLLADYEMVLHDFKKKFSNYHFAREYLGLAGLNLSKKTIDRLVDALNTYNESSNKPTLQSIPQLLFCDCTDDKKVWQFFDQWGMRKVGFRMHLGTLASWLSILGAGMIERQIALSSHHEMEDNLTSGADSKAPAIFSAFDNTDTISDSVRRNLLEYGLTINPDTLYRSHSMMRKTLLPALIVYCNTTRDVGLVMPSFEEDYLYASIFMLVD